MPGTAANPVRLNPFRRIVEVGWPSEEDSDYLAVLIRIVSSDGTDIANVSCGGEVEATPGYASYGSGYGTSQTYNYEVGDLAFYTANVNSDGGEWSSAWGLLGAELEVTGPRTTDTETIGGAWEAYRPPFGGRVNTEFARFTPITDESGPVTVPYSEFGPGGAHNFGGVAEVTAEYLCGIMVGVLGCAFGGSPGGDPPEGYYQYKAIHPDPVGRAVTSDLASSVVVTYLENILPLVGVATERRPDPGEDWWLGNDDPDFGPISVLNVKLPREAWLLYRIPASSA